MPADVLKVPREFVSEIAVGNRSFAVVNAIVAVGHALGLAVVAEGVETPTQESLLRRLGVVEAQGYYFSRPISPQAFSAMYTSGLLMAA